MEFGILSPFFFAGEQLARDELFMFIVSIFSQFSLTWNPEEPKPEMEAVLSVTLAPLDHSLILSERS